MGNFLNNTLTNIWHPNLAAELLSYWVRWTNIHPLSERLRRGAVAGNRFCPRKAASSCPASWSEGPMGPSVTSTLRPRMHGEIPPKIAGSISGLVEGTTFFLQFSLKLISPNQETRNVVNTTPLLMTLLLLDRYDYCDYTGIDWDCDRSHWTKKSRTQHQECKLAPPKTCQDT